MAYIPDLHFDKTSFYQQLTSAPKEDRIAADRYMAYYQQYMWQALQYGFIMFEWKNLPESIDPRYLEKILHLKGKIAIVRDTDMLPISKTTGKYLEPIFAFPYTIIGQKDMEGFPVRIQCYSINNRYHKQFNVGIDFVRTKVDGIDNISIGDKDMAIVGFNDTVSMPTPFKILPMVENIADMEMTRKNRLTWHKAPFIYQAPKALLHSVQMAFRKIVNNERVIFEVENFSNSIGLREINQNVEFINDKLRLEINAEWDRIMLFLGVDNTNQDKNERMIEDEVNSNNEQIWYSKYLMLTERQKLCEQINLAFGLNVSVRLRSTQEILDSFNAIYGEE